MAEQTQIQQVTMKDPKKEELGKRLAEYNHRKREKLVQMKTQRESETKLTYYGARSVIAIGVVGIISYYVYQSKTPEETTVNQTNEALVH